MAHHGIKGQKWGVRRFQNPDGTLTEAGKKHTQKENYKYVKSLRKKGDFYTKSRSVLPKDKIDDLAKAKDAFYKKTFGKSNAEKDAEYLKPGGINDMINQIADQTFGKYKKRIGYTATQRIIDWAAGDTLEAAYEKSSFQRFRKILKGKGNDRQKASKILDGMGEDTVRVMNYISKNSSKLINEFWDKKMSGSISYEDFENVANSYAKKAAKQLGLPESKVTYYFLRDWYFNGDD